MKRRWQINYKWSIAGQAKNRYGMRLWWRWCDETFHFPNNIHRSWETRTVKSKVSQSFIYRREKAVSHTDQMIVHWWIVKWPNWHPPNGTLRGRHRKARREREAGAKLKHLTNKTIRCIKRARIPVHRNVMSIECRVSEHVMPTINLEHCDSPDPSNHRQSASAAMNKESVREGNEKVPSRTVTWHYLIISS